MQTGSTKRGLFSWALYDWANSAVPTVIITFIFSAYFTRSVAPDEITGSQVWGTVVGISGFLVAILGPLLGSAADHTGRRKPWILLFTLLCVASTAGLWWILPDASLMWQAALLVGAATIGLELAIVLYNAMLPDLVGKAYIGRWSGWGWALGYAGGLLCLVVVLFLFIEEESRIVSFDTESAGHLRAGFVFVAAWFAIFSIPFFLFTGETRKSGVSLGRGVREGLAQLADTVRHVRRYSHIVRFLVARIFYVDGMATLFAFGGVYAAGTFGMDEKEILLFGIALNVTAGLGAFLFSWVDDYMGSQRTILLSLAGIIIPGTVLLLAQSETVFWIAGLVIGIFVGPVQSASRSYMAHVAPPDMTNQMFGLLAFSGKATAFLGPLLVGWLTWATGSQRIGMSVIIILLCAGFLIMLKVPRVLERDSAVVRSSPPDTVRQHE
ncbi:MAG: MFS transporter [Gammaproteobacteria bacterium]